MKSRPILMSTPMVQAILAGRKTQTRRTVTPGQAVHIQWFGPGDEEPAQTDDIELLYRPMEDDDGKITDPQWQIRSADYPEEGAIPFGQLYGAVGDQLWVRETFCPIYPQDPNYNGGRPIAIDYKATPTERMADHLGVRKWKPSIFMPRDASRITLEITGLRLERLHDISEEDAAAEGWPGPDPTLSGVEEIRRAYPIGWYAGLWNSINGVGAYDRNPWVWVISFKRISRQEPI